RLDRVRCGLGGRARGTSSPAERRNEALALDRQTIEKKDFPIARRGYEAEAVDAHLQGVADEVETLGRAARASAEAAGTEASTPSLASAAASPRQATVARR